MAINSEQRDDRGACQQIGFCFQGCKSGAKWSTLIAEIPKGARSLIVPMPQQMVPPEKFVCCLRLCLGGECPSSRGAIAPCGAAALDGSE